MIPGAINSMKLTRPLRASRRDSSAVAALALVNDVSELVVCKIIDLPWHPQIHVVCEHAEVPPEMRPSRHSSTVTGAASASSCSNAAKPGAVQISDIVSQYGQTKARTNAFIMTRLICAVVQYSKTYQLA